MLITIHWNWHVNRKKSGVCEAQTVTALPRANEEPAGGGAEKTDNVGVMFISCCVPIALQGLTLTSGINLFPSNIPVKLVCSMKGQQLHLHILLPLSNALARHQDYDLWILHYIVTDDFQERLFSEGWLTVPWLPNIRWWHSVFWAGEPGTSCETSMNLYLLSPQSFLDFKPPGPKYFLTSVHEIVPSAESDLTLTQWILVCWPTWHV